MKGRVKKILVISSGGDAPGMNAAIRAVVRTAIHHGLEPMGTEQGFCGLLSKQIFPLNVDSVANIIQRGGTILKTGRCIPFQDATVRKQCGEFLKSQQIDGMVILGGDGSFRGATKFTDETGIPVIGIPCTIDNDITGTDYCIGFDTARNTALDAIDKIRDTALSLDRNFIIEVMGRSTGHIAVDVGIAGGAEFILIPEFPISPETLVEKLKHPRRTKLASIIVAAEANRPGSSIELAHTIKELSEIEYKVCILGHTQRGGSPTTHDRKVASMMGTAAIEALREHRGKSMTAMQNHHIAIVPFPDPKNATRYFQDESLLTLNEILCGT